MKDTINEIYEYSIDRLDKVLIGLILFCVIWITGIISVCKIQENTIERNQYVIINQLSKIQAVQNHYPTNLTLDLNFHTDKK